MPCNTPARVCECMFNSLEANENDGDRDKDGSPWPPVLQLPTPLVFVYDAAAIPLLYVPFDCAVDEVMLGSVAAIDETPSDKNIAKIGSALARLLRALKPPPAPTVPAPLIAAADP